MRSDAIAALGEGQGEEADGEEEEQGRARMPQLLAQLVTQDGRRRGPFAQRAHAASSR
ncbi:hypothetical protein D3C87_2192670 [compost metagenome]